MKKILTIIIFLLMLTGCTKLDGDINKIINVVLSKSQVVNTVSTNYKIYIPNGVIKLEDSNYNQKFKIKDRYLYLYVDTISYHYKNTTNYLTDETYNYFYQKVNYNNKTGYIGINKLEDDLYYVKMVYNYAKMEFYSDEENLVLMVTNSLVMLNSIEYNDKLITASLEDNISIGKDNIYEFKTPEGTVSSFYDDLQQYVIEEDEQEETILPDEE